MLIYLVVPYLVVVGLFSALQRSMIYYPTRKGTLPPEDARLPAGQVHAVELETDDGLRLHGWHFLADGRRAWSRRECDQLLAEGRKLVVFFSGNAGDRRYRNLDGKDLADLGLEVFLFDYRGYGDNPGSPSEKHFTADARSIWRYVTQTRSVGPDRVILYGESLGGAVATRLAAERCEAGEPPAAIVLRSTFSSLVNVGAWHFPWLPVRLLLRDRYPAIQHIASVTCPLLQVHGADDDIVPIQLGRKLFAAAPDRSASGIEKRFVELPDAGHNDLMISHFREPLAELLDSLDAAGERREERSGAREHNEIRPQKTDSERRG